jgi:hypothetical protein
LEKYIYMIICIDDKKLFLSTSDEVKKLS